jgi:membrane associated rhomboid family serine protease
VQTLLGRRTPVTTLLLVVIAVVFMADLGTGSQLTALGADQRDLVLAGQWWRPLTSMFLHDGFAHVLLNGWALYQLGALFEILLGSGPLLAVFLTTGLAGSCASLLWSGRPSVGASGAIFGLMGALIAFLFRRREMLTPYAKSLLGQLVLWAGINVVFGLSMPRIDNAAHFGGCAAGLLLGLLLKGRQPRSQPRSDLPPDSPNSQQIAEL